MIHVQVKRDQHHHITEVIIDGHAGYAKSGYDLVCAAVSSVTVGTANAIEALLSVEVVKAVGDSGFLHFMVPAIADVQRLKEVQLLLEAMIVTLNTIADSHTDEVKSVSKYIQVIDNL